MIVQASCGAGAAIGGLKLIPNDLIIPADSVHPDNGTTVWPTPHDPKIDVITIMRAVFHDMGLDNVGVSKNGSFDTSALTNSEGQSVPHIVVTRTSDKEKRYGIGKHFGVFGSGDARMIDDEQLVQPGGVVGVRGTYSQVTIDVNIFDLNSPRADQMYLIVKYILEAALETFNAIGYTTFIRTNGVDSAQINMEPTPYVIYNRTLTYYAEYPTFVDTIEQALNLVKQTLVFDTQPGADLSTILP